MVKLKEKPKASIGSRIAKEIKRLYRLHKGNLQPVHVVEAGSDPDNPLHSQFNWDDAAAAHDHRLWQARQLIARVRVIVPQSETKTVSVRAYHAIRSERGGYRHTRDIMSDDDLRADLLGQMASDLNGLRNRYTMLSRVAEAAKVFTVIEEFVGSQSKKSA